MVVDKLSNLTNGLIHESHHSLHGVLDDKSWRLSWGDLSL